MWAVWEKQKPAALAPREPDPPRLQPAYQLSQDLGLDVKVVTRIYQRLREALYHVTELEASKLKGEIELDEAYFGGKRKGQRGRSPAGKNVVFGLLERKGSAYCTDAFRGHQSLKRYGHHHTVNHAKTLVGRRTKNPINGIEGFWSYAKHILYQYRGVSQYHFPLYLKEIEYRFNHRQENVFKQFLKI